MNLSFYAEYSLKWICARVGSIVFETVEELDTIEYYIVVSCIYSIN